MSYSKSYYALRNPTEDKQILDYKNSMMKKQLEHEKNELNKRLQKTKANVRFMGNGKSSIETVISDDMESDKPKPLGRMMGNGITGGNCGCEGKGKSKKKVEKKVRIDDIMNMEERVMKGKGMDFQGSGSMDEIITIANKHKKEMKGGMKKEGGAKKPNKWIEFVNKTRKETGKSLKDTLKHIKQNNLYKKE